MDRSNEYDADSEEPADRMEVVAVGSDDEYDLRDHNQIDELDSEYGDIEDTDMPSIPRGFYRKSVRRQNCFFGISLMHIIAAFIGAYFLMDMSFTRSNIGIFGDEASMEGSSGEVGIDASNAEVQEIVDEEIIELEEAGNWGENAKRVGSNQHLDDLIKSRNKVGMHSWAEKKQWWNEHKDDLDESKMTSEEKKVVKRFKKKEEKQKRHEERKKRAEERHKNKLKGRGKGNGHNKDKDSNNKESQVEEPEEIEDMEAHADATDLSLIDKVVTKYKPDPRSSRPNHKKHHGHDREKKKGKKHGDGDN